MVLHCEDHQSLFALHARDVCLRRMGVAGKRSHHRRIVPAKDSFEAAREILIAGPQHQRLGKAVTITHAQLFGRTVTARLVEAINAWVASPENRTRRTVTLQRAIEPMTMAQAQAFLNGEHAKLTRIARSLKLAG
jgi:hypothetical protein